MPERPVGDFFDVYARDFDALYGTRRSLANAIVNPLLRRSMRLRHERVLAGCTPAEGARILDVGCGPGHQSVELARRGALVTGVDLAPRMVAIARGHAAEAGVDSRCTFLEGDFLDLAWDEPFDFVVVLGVMDYVAEPEPFVARVLAACRQTAFFSFPTAGGFLAWQRRLRYRSRCPLFLYERERLEGLLAALAPGRSSIDRIARDWFVTAQAGQR